jgi:hypothetical protein
MLLRKMNPIPPAANPCCNRGAVDVVSGLGAGNATTQFHSGNCSFRRWPLAARAQQAARSYSIAYLVLSGDQDASLVKQRLGELGYNEGKNLSFNPGDEAFTDDSVVCGYGMPMTYHGVEQTISRTTAETIGVSVCPHLFRAAGASTAAVYAGEKPFLGSTLLHQRDHRVCEEHYNRASTLNAVQAYGDLIRDLRR